MSTLDLFISATGPMTCLNIFRQWTQSFPGGCAAIVMDESSDKLLLPCVLIFAGTRKGRLFRHERSEFHADALVHPKELATLHGLQVPVGFLTYFRNTIKSFPITPLPILSLLETGSDVIIHEVARVVEFHKSSKSVCAFGSFVGAIAHPTAIFLTVDTDTWHVFWTLATKFKVHRKGCSKQMDPLAECTYVVDFTKSVPSDPSGAPMDYSDPDNFMLQFEQRYRAAAEYWIITKKDAFLILFIMSAMYPKIESLLSIPTLDTSH
jgi:hypothetical protein